MQSLLQKLLLGNAGGGGGGNPSLNLNFVDGSAFDPRITFSRTTNATLTDSTGLVAYAPHNLLTYSEDFSNAAWTASNTTVTVNSTVAPDGATTADKLVENTATSTHLINLTTSASFTSGVSYTLTVYAKAAERYRGLFTLSTGTTAFGSIVTANFDLQAGTITAATGSPTVSITAVGNGWYRLSISKAAVATVTEGGTGLRMADATGATTYTGDGTSGLFIWGAQLNVNPMAGGVTSSLSTYYPTTATAYYGPRFDYDPVTLAAKGLLIEEQRTNLFTQSEFASGVPAGVGLITASTMLGPDGNSVNAAAFGHNGTTDTWLYKGSVTASTQYAISVYVRMDDGNAPAFGSATATNSANDFVFVVGGGLVSPLTYTVTNVGNNLYRVSAVITSGTTNLVNNGVLKYATNSNRTFKTTAWQIEAGAFATSYIPTVASQVTRNADVASVNTLSPWFNASTGSIYAEGDITGSPASNRLYEFHDGTDNNRLFTYTVNSANSVRFQGNSGGVSTEATNLSFSPASGVPFKSVGAYTSGEYAICVNGGVVATAAPAALPVGLTTMVLGARRTGAQVLNGHIRRITYYPTRLTNAALQQITT